MIKYDAYWMLFGSLKEKQWIVKLCEPWGQFCVFADPADPDPADPATLYLKLINDC